MARQRQEGQPRPEVEAPDGSFERVPTHESRAGEPHWPRLSDTDQQVVDAWWEEVRPVYVGRDYGKRCGWLLERVLAFLGEHPRLFRYLYLHEEFLFEFGGALARAGRMGDYLALLLRLRDEQPEVYFECFGYYDEDLLTEALRTGRRQDIPACLRLFREHPVKHIDQFAAVVDLLAWRGCEAELRELLEPTSQRIADSPEVLEGGFGLQWLTHLAMFPFLEAGDDSAAAVDEMWKAATAPGCLGEDEGHNRERLARALRLSCRSAAEAHLDLRVTKSEWLYSDVGWNFTGWVRRTKGLTWSSARYLANALLDYWGWQEETKKPRCPFGLNETRLNRYLAQRCRSIICIHGVRALSTLQAFHYLTDYLVAHDCLKAADAARLQAAAAGFYTTIRGAVDSCDSGCRLCPTYETLIAAPSRDSLGGSAQPTEGAMPS